MQNTLVYGFWDNIDSYTQFLKASHHKTDEYSATACNIPDQRLILKSIEVIFLNLLDSVNENKSPLLIIPKPKWTNTKCNWNEALEIENPANKQILFHKQNQCRTFALTLHVLSKIYKLISTNTISTKRELYYQNVALYGNQSVIDDVIDDITRLLQVPRRQLNIISTPKGCIAGNLTFNDADGSFVDCSNSEGILIPSDVDAITAISSEAKFIFIIEKDAIFQKLLNENFLKKFHPCIIITGKGFPDVNTRLMVKKLFDSLLIPPLILTDPDPYGIEIMCNYRFGSLSLVHEGSTMAVPASRWLGILPTDLIRLGVKEECLLPLADTDEQKLLGLLRRPYFQNDLQLRFEVQHLLDLTKKAEIESMESLGMNFLTSVYISTKLRLGSWI